MITPFIMLICVAAFNGLYLWNKYTLWNNGYRLRWSVSIVGETSKMFQLARKTESHRLRISYMIRAWLIPLFIPVLIVMLYNITWPN
jgi:hypothetical protein